MKCFSLGTETPWLVFVSGVRGRVLYWGEVVCGHMLSDSSDGAFFDLQTLGMHLIVNWQSECMLSVERALLNMNRHTVDTQINIYW